MLTVSLGLQQSLLIQAQRRLLDQMGERIGTPVVYLKAAWADPVLYAGRGERVGGDIDILVRPERFRAYAHSLAAAGFKRFHDRWHVASQHFVGKAWLYQPPSAYALAVDLHRELVDGPWFKFAAEGLVDRAVAYASVDGKILSLAPEDQVVYAAAHYANHRYSLGPQHLNDMVALLSQVKVNWNLIRDRADESFLSVPLLVLIAALRQRGVAVPVHAEAAAWLHRWSAILCKWLLDSDHLQRQSPMVASDLLWLMPLLSNRKSALPRYLIRLALVRPLDCAAELVYRLAGKS